jgi:hypothetical protein
MSLVGKTVFIRQIDGKGIPSVQVIGEDDWSITIMWSNSPKVIPRSQIKEIEVSG